ncbi:hypothetical protein [Rhodanobacter sp. L36]|uniref:hypothetical protein n=1 Tax=Rhodanobacter sp. L36 TaxID=1747221 RepID=UPI00131BE8AE|nr:hypothetical protein [Rhodanobacter sp. L36]
MRRRAYAWWKKGTLLIAVTGSTGALAVTYTFSRDGQADVPVCLAVQQALSRGLILDAQKPLCYRRFDVSIKATRYGFKPINFTPVSNSRYRSLLSQMMSIVNNSKLPLTKADKHENEAAVSRLMSSGAIKLYRAPFDNNNSGSSHVVYFLDSVRCPGDVEAPRSMNPTIFMENADGTLNRSWGVGDETSGSPFIYRGQTYYIRWTSLVGAALKNAWSQLDIYHNTPALPSSPPQDHETFSPPDCTIYQMKKGIR